MNALEQLSEYRWQRPPHYCGHSPDGDIVAAAITRDSSVLEESNWHSMRAIIERHAPIQTDYDPDAPLAPYDFRAGHWAVGWVEYLIVPAGAAEPLLREVAEALCSLADYPVLDDDDYSERQWNAQCDYWETLSTSERVDYLRDAGLSIFAARHDYGAISDDCGLLAESLAIH